MKPRARRVTVGAAALLAVTVAVLVLANWGTVRDHVEAWWFQATREMETVVPSPTLRVSPELEIFVARGDDHTLADLAGLLLMLATKSGRTVVFDQAEKKDLPLKSAGDSVLSVLEANGYRVLEQRFPRRAYVMIRSAEPFKQNVEILIKDAQRADPPPYGLHAEYPATERP